MKLSYKKRVFFVKTNKVKFNYDQLHTKGIIMNRSKLIGATALASVMAASAANAQMSISAYINGSVTDNDGGGITQALSTNSIYVSYSDSLDNGMGVAVTMSLSGGGTIVTDINIDTGLGTIGLGSGQDSAVDAFDSNPGCFSLIYCYNVAISGKNGGVSAGTVSQTYDDADSSSGNSIAYSNSINGVSFRVTRGMGNDDALDGVDPVMSYAASTSIMGATIAAGVSSIDYVNVAHQDRDPNFLTVGYSIAGLNLGYAVYDSDDGSEETHMGVGTSVAGMDVGVQFADRDFTTDTDYMRVSVNKGMGAASFGIDYLETDVAGGSASDTDKWVFNYVVGF